MEPQGKKGLAIAAMVLGIVSCVLAWIYMVNIAAIITGGVGLVLAIMANNSYKAIGQKNGMATAGLVLSIIGLAIGLIGFFACTICVCCTSQAVNSAVTSGDWAELQDLANQLSSLQ